LLAQETYVLEEKSFSKASSIIAALIAIFLFCVVVMLFRNLKFKEEEDSELEFDNEELQEKLIDLQRQSVIEV